MGHDLHHVGERGGICTQRNGKNRHEHCRFCQRGDGHLPARSHTAKGRADIHPRQGGEKPYNRKEHDQGDNIGRVGKGEVNGDERDDPADQDGDTENDIWGETENP